MSRSFMVCVEKKVMDTMTAFLVYGITKLGYFLETAYFCHFGTLIPSQVLFITVVHDSSVTDQLVLSSFCLSFHSALLRVISTYNNLHTCQFPQILELISMSLRFLCSRHLLRRLLVSCVFSCKEGKEKLKEIKEAFTVCEMMPS